MMRQLVTSGDSRKANEWRQQKEVKISTRYRLGEILCSGFVAN